YCHHRQNIAADCKHPSDTKPEKLGEPLSCGSIAADQSPARHTFLPIVPPWETGARLLYNPLKRPSCLRQTSLWRAIRAFSSRSEVSPLKQPSEVCEKATTCFATTTVSIHSK